MPDVITAVSTCTFLARVSHHWLSGIISPAFESLLGGSWVVISGVITSYKSPTIGYSYSYPTHKPSYTIYT